jgi:transposase
MSGPATSPLRRQDHLRQRRSTRSPPQQDGISAGTTLRGPRATPRSVTEFAPEPGTREQSQVGRCVRAEVTTPSRSSSVRPSAPLPLGHHRRGLAAHRPAHRRRQTWRQAGSLPTPGHRRRDPLPRPQRLRLAGTTGRPAAWRTVYHYFRTRTCDGTLSRLHNHLREQVRRTDGRATDPTAVIVDSQSVRGAEIVAKADRGYAAGKKVNGRKRHLVVDTTGLLLVTLVTTAGIRDRDAARLLLTGLRTCFPTIERVWADGGYAGQLIVWAATTLRLALDIVRKFAGHTTFQPLPRILWNLICRVRPAMTNQSFSKERSSSPASARGSCLQLRGGAGPRRQPPKRSPSATHYRRHVSAADLLAPTLTFVEPARCGNGRDPLAPSRRQYCRQRCHSAVPT